MIKRQLRPDRDLAIIGMSCRFPGANTVEEYWENLKNGRESIIDLEEEDLKATGIAPTVWQNPDYVKAAAAIDDVENFDARFFGYSPKEAASIDPQQRIFLELAWEALENSGCVPERFPGSIAVFAGSGLNTYLINNLLGGRKMYGNVQGFLLQIANDKDNLATRVSYKLNLKGPSISVQTACSTSVVAIHLACQSLLACECDLALAGAVTVKIPQKAGYYYTEEMILSPDGHCRPFDAKAKGTIFGSGAGIVVLKRLRDALNDRDHIIAVIKGSAVNNDGVEKIGYTAPSVQGQKEVILKALQRADVQPESIGAIEAHGTGTILGDPLEMQALKEVFGGKNVPKNSCALGSVKGNLGHLENAAGIAGVIKMALCLKQKQLVPSINFEQPNPLLEMENTPFYVNTEERQWTAGEGFPLRAGVSSFGIGGTNAHLILEEPPPSKASTPSTEVQLFNISAKTETALRQATENLAQYLEKQAPKIFSDIAYSLQMGRQAFQYRQTLVCADPNQIVQDLRSLNPERVWSAQSLENPKTVFMFPGQGSQYVNMAHDLYRYEPVFQREVDRCAAIIEPYLGVNIRKALFPKKGSGKKAEQELNQTLLAQPALFIIEYALAVLLREWGVIPQVMLGHSIGEYVAACLGGVLTLEEALWVVSQRALLMSELPPGKMGVVSLSESETKELLPEKLSLASVNGPNLTVVSGPPGDIDEFMALLNQKGVSTRLLHTSHAFHSTMMMPMAQPFLEIMRRIPLKPPIIPYFSNVSGALITAAEATDAHYWVKHLLQPVRMYPAILSLSGIEEKSVFLEVGPGTVMNSLVKAHDHQQYTVNTLPHALKGGSARQSLVASLGRLWIAGIDVRWSAFHEEEKRKKIPVPTYPFERKRFWIEATVNEGDLDNQEIEMDDELEDDEPLNSINLACQPETEREKGLAAIFQSILGVTGIGLQDDFFRLGGHSLLATQLLLKVNRGFGTKITLNEFFQCPTVTGLNKLIAASGNTGAGIEDYNLPEVTPDPESRYESFPLTEMQQAQWLGRLGNFNISNVAAHVYFEMEKAGIDLGRLSRSWQGMIDRHEMLRAVFMLEGVQKILKKPLAYEIKNLDLRQALPETISAQLAEIRERMDHIVRPVDQWPLFEVRTTQLPGEVVRIHFSIDLLICDIGSMRLLLREWAQSYKEPELTLPKLELSFRDYVLAERKIKQTPLYEKSNQYWERRVPELPSMPLLPTARNPADINKPSYKRVSLSMAKPVWEELKQRGIAKQISPSILLLTAFAHVLANWSKTAHFCINTTMINRLPLHPQVSMVVGEFASFAPLEVKITSALTFEEVARNFHQQSWMNLEHRYLSGTSILRKIAQHRGEATGAVLPVVFTSTLVHVIEGENETVEQFGGFSYLISQTPQVWLDHAVLEDEAGLTLSWHYIEDLFPPGMIATMWKTYETLLYRLAAYADAWQGHYFELTPLEQLEQREVINNTQSEFAGELLQTSFLAQAGANPDRPAVITAERELSYGQLAEWSNRLGGYLRGLGVTCGDLVAVVMEKDWHQIVGVMGILQSGAAYLPIAPDLPAERLAYILNNAAVKVVLTQEQCDFQLTWPENVVRLPITETWLNQLAAVAEIPSVTTGADLAYVIYTSGSTGLPKGVKVTHQGAVNTITDINRRFKVNGQDRVLALSELNFDLSVYDIFGVLAAGGAVVTPSAQHVKDPRHWLDLIGQHRVTIWNSVPALMEMMVEYLDNPAERLPLRLALLSGDWIPVGLPIRLQDLAPELEIVSLGGATEASIWSVIYPIKTVAPDWPSIPYGKPLTNQTLHVLNESLGECPVWVTGKLYIGGTGLAEGYLNDPDLTAKAFIVHPRTQQRLYLTGDLGRYLPDGNIEFLGREDNQVKISGFRIELGEIETVLQQHPAVKRAVVTARGKTNNKTRLIGYLVMNDGANFDLAGLEAYLRKKLPDYMIPSQFMEVDSFPLTANGKINRNALPEPEFGTEREITTKGDNYLTARLIAIFAEVFDSDPEKIDINANFFTMGGDSIMGIQAITKAGKEGISISPQQLFENPTILSLAQVLEKDQFPREKRSRYAAEILRLTPLQYQLFKQLGYSAKYVNWGLLSRMLQPLDADILERAFADLVMKTDALQIHYQWKHTQWIQTYQTAAAPAELDLVDTTGLTLAELETVSETVWKELEFNQELADSPLIKVCLFEDRQRQLPQYLLVMANYLITDCRSLGLFLNELYCGYCRIKAGQDSKATLPSITFGDVLAGMPEADGNSALDRLDETLGRYLPQQPPVFDLGTGDAEDSSEERSKFVTILDSKDTETLFEDTLNYIKMSPEEFLIAVWTAFCQKAGKAEAVYLHWLTGLLAKDGDKADRMAVIGNLDQLLPLYLKVDPLLTIEDRLKQVKQDLRNFLRDAGPHYWATDRLHDVLGHAPQPEIKFGYHGSLAVPDIPLEGLKLKVPWLQKQQQNLYKLEIDAVLYQNEVQFYWNYDPTRCADKVVRAVADGFTQQLRAVMDHVRHKDCLVVCPGDFSTVAIRQEELETLIAAISEQSLESR